MSAIALAWVASVKVGNQTAKQLLSFYASHNFNKPELYFANETLASQLECSLSSIQRAHKLLVNKKLITREQRFSPTGRELITVTYLNVPDEFVDQFFNKYKPDKPSKVGCQSETPRGVTENKEGVMVIPLNNNINNNKNKRERESKNSSTENQKTPLPLGFKSKPETVEKIEALPLTGDQKMLEYQKFICHYTDSKEERHDWDAVLYKWMLMAYERIMNRSKKHV